MLPNKSILLLAILFTFAGLARAQTVNCSISAPLGSTARATANGHTEPVATITGVDLAGAIAVTFSGTGVSGILETEGTDTSLPVTIEILPGAELGLRTVSVTTGVGTSAPFVGFNVGLIRKTLGQVTSQ